MLKEKYDRMLDQFQSYYPYLYDTMVDWWPSGRTCINVKLNDNSIIEFESFDNTIRKVKSKECDGDSESLRKTIGNNIKKMIRARSISQNEIAEKCGITEAMLSRYIHGTSMPGIDKIYILSKVLDCRVTDIIEETYD